MKILMLRSNPFEPDERVYKEAKSLIKFGYNVKVLCWDRTLNFPEKEIYEGIEIERVRLKSGYGSMKELVIKMPLFWTKAFLKSINQDFDFIHCYDYDTLPIGTLLKFFKGKKIIYDALELFCSYTSNKTTNKIIFIIERMNLPFIDALIYTNEERLKLFLKKTQLNKKTVVIHNYPQFGSNFLKKNYDNICFQYNGRINRDRNILNIVKAFKELSDEKTKFYIIGDYQSDYGYEIKKYIEDNYLKDKIILMGFIPINEILDFSKNVHIGFVPLVKDSLNNIVPEPNKLYNYFATGNFAVVENVPYLKKIVEDEDIGISCDFSNIEDIKDRVVWILENKEKVEEMTKKAYDMYLKKYNWENEEKKLIKLYKEI